MGASFSNDASVAPPSLEDFDLLAVIGQGAFGKVWQVRKKDSGRIYAMKVLKKKDILEANLVERATLEMEIMAKLGSHPFIVTLHYAFQNGEKLYLVMDYMSGGSLFGHIRKSPRPFSEAVVRSLLAETILALAALHKANIVYRDLKLENVLLDSDGHVRLTDFGLSAKMKKGRKIHDYSGTAVYLAPEIVTDIKGSGHGKSVDIWSLGVLSHLLLTQRAPYWHPDTQTLLHMIRTERVSLVHCAGLSPDCQSLLSGLLVRDPRARLGCGPDGIEEIKHHPFFKDVDWDAVLAKQVEPLYKPGVKDDTDYSCLDADAYLPEVNDSDVRLLAELQRQPKSAKKSSAASSKGKHFSNFQYVKSSPSAVAVGADAERERERDRDRELSPHRLSSVVELVADLPPVPSGCGSSDDVLMSPPLSPRELSRSPSLSPHTSPPMSPERSRRALSPEPSSKDDRRSRPKFSLAKIKSMFSDGEEQPDDDFVAEPPSATTTTVAAVGGNKKQKLPKFRIAKRRLPGKFRDESSHSPSPGPPPASAAALASASASASTAALTSASTVALQANESPVRRAHKKTSSAPAAERSRMSLSLSSAQVLGMLANPDEHPATVRLPELAAEQSDQLAGRPPVADLSGDLLPPLGGKKKKKKRHRRRVDSELTVQPADDRVAAAASAELDIKIELEAKHAAAELEAKHSQVGDRSDSDGKHSQVGDRGDSDAKIGQLGDRAESDAKIGQLGDRAESDAKIGQIAEQEHKPVASPQLRLDAQKKSAAQRQRELQERLERERQEREELWAKLQTRQLLADGQDTDERTRAFRDERARIDEDRVRVERLRQEEAERQRREKEQEERERREREEEERRAAEARRNIERFNQRLRQIEAEREEANRQLSLYEKKPAADSTRPLSEEEAAPRQEPAAQSVLLPAEGAFVPYQMLVSHPENFDRLQLERYLSPGDFVQVFQIEQAAFYSLPKWKQNLLKRNAKLL